MTLLIGTDQGVYRVEDIPFGLGEEEAVLDCGRVTSIRRFDHASGVFVTSATGLHRTHNGRSWENLGLPSAASETWSVLVTADGTIYSGTNDPYLYRSMNDGESWQELAGFRQLPSRGLWESPVNPHRARLRALESPPDKPEQLMVGIESGGIHVSRDNGDTWTDLREHSPDDVHQILPLGRDVFLAVTGYLDLDLEHLGLGHAIGTGGLFLTTNAGNVWRRLDEGNEYGYLRQAYFHDGTLFFGGATTQPGEWRTDEIDAALFKTSNLGRTIERVSYPGEPGQVVEAFTEHDGRLIAGSARFRDPDPSDEASGRIIQRDDDDEFQTVGELSRRVTSLAVL